MATFIVLRQIIQNFYTFHFNRHRISHQRLQLLSKEMLNQQLEKLYLNTFYQQMLIHFYYQVLACGIFNMHQKYDHIEINLLQIPISSL